MLYTKRIVILPVLIDVQGADIHNLVLKRQITSTYATKTTNEEQISLHGGHYSQYFLSLTAKQAFSTSTWCFNRTVRPIIGLFSPNSAKKASL